MIKIPSILQQLFYGNIRPDINFFDQEPSFTEATRNSAATKDKLTALLNEQEKDFFDKFCESRSEISEIGEYSNFSYGFKLGALLMAEAFTGINQLSPEGFVSI